VEDYPIAGLDTSSRRTLTNSNVLTYSVKDFKKKHDFDVLMRETYDLRVKTGRVFSGIIRA
jgi:hypothetical protein